MARRNVSAKNQRAQIKSRGKAKTNFSVFALDTLRRLQEAHYNGANELWLKPFLRHLAGEMPLLADWERRRLLEGLTNHGALRTEKRPGESYPHSVMILNHNHPDVWDPA